MRVSVSKRKTGIWKYIMFTISNIVGLVLPAFRVFNVRIVISMCGVVSSAGRKRAA
jgi:hypothetical protein